MIALKLQYVSVSLGGEDETKTNDVQSLGSGAGEYEPISDDELDEILAGDAEKREDQQEDEKMPGKSISAPLCDYLNIKIRSVYIKCCCDVDSISELGVQSTSRFCLCLNAFQVLWEEWNCLIVLSSAEYSGLYQLAF